MGGSTAVADLRAPFVWFGGKRRVAPEVWAAIGPVDNYVEPFAGSLAVLLGRPDDRWQTGAETVNDLDGYLANFWRALTAAPEEVARYADWPVNEVDLTARHAWLVTSGRERLSKLQSDPDFYDAKVAGWWVWGVNAWIGSGWCFGNGPWVLDADGILVDSRQRPHLGNAGKGINRQLPHLGSRGNDKPGKEASREALTSYFCGLARRLKRVRVCCGDWQRVVTMGALAYGSTVGVFLDPPYDEEVRDNSIYSTDRSGQESLSAEVRAWALANGDDPRLRIVLAGYEEEHAEAMPPTWRKLSYSASKAYGSRSAVGSGEGNDANRHNERLWFSPHCLRKDQRQGQLFRGDDA